MSKSNIERNIGRSLLKNVIKFSGHFSFNEVTLTTVAALSKFSACFLPVMLMMIAMPSVEEEKSNR